MNKNREKYPTPYEVSEVLTNFVKRGDANKYAQSLGLIVINANHSDISSEISNLLLAKEDIDNLRSLAYKTNSKHTLSGFTLISDSPNFDIENLYSNVRDKGDFANQGYSLKSLSKVTYGEKEYFKGAIEYIKRKPGRIQFFEEEKGFCEFRLFEMKKGEWQIEIDGNKSSDGKEVYNLFSKMIDTKNTCLFDMRIDLMDNKSTISFFDELGKFGMGTDWMLSNVTQLTLKRSVNKESEDISEDEEEIEIEQLTGIRQAILDGRDLRQDPFVSKYEESGGCIFTAMTYEFENTKTPETIQIRAEFKGNPKIFEVTIIDYLKTEGVNTKKRSSEMSSEDNIKYRSIFWNKSKEIYKKCISTPSK